ncbi:MAG TPA: copper chaperone PCu(A)C [Actinotalea sp.]|nr:copper chaperone PCu(A)C [Actinotalea sp.]
MRRTTPRRAIATIATILLALGLTGCDATGPATDEPALTVTDPWVKAADAGMTAAFGTLVNHTDEEIRIVAAGTDLATVELHEVAAGADGAMVMRPKVGGFAVPADGSHELMPGGDHLMLMALTAPVQPGDEIEITLESADGSTWTFTASARTFDGAQEDYVGDAASAP